MDSKKLGMFMNVSWEASVDIMKYLQEKKGQSVDDIASSMNASPEHIQKVANKKEQLTIEDVNAYLKTNDLHFWEFAIEAIPLSHLTPKAKKRILLCQELANHIKKNK
jgi:hypothetical protein